MKKQWWTLAVVAALGACAAPQYSEEQVRDKVLTFNMHVQSRAYNSALEMITKEERKLMAAEDGKMLEQYQNAVRNLRASTLLQENFTLDKHGKIIGMKPVLDQAMGFGEDVTSGLSDSAPSANESATETPVEGSGIATE